MNESDGGDDDATVAFRLTDMTSTNTLFRRVVYTGVYQLVLMSLNEEETLEDMQPSVDQMISVTSGTISVKLGGKHVYQLVPGSCLNIKMGVYFSAEATSIRMDTSNLSAARATFWILYSAPIFPQQLIQDNNLDLGTFSPSTTPKQGHVPPRLSGSKIPCLIILQSDLSFPGVERELGRVIPMGNFKQSFTSGEEQPNLTLYLVALTTRLETTSITRTELAAAKSNFAILALEGNVKSSVSATHLMTGEKVLSLLWSPFKKQFRDEPNAKLYEKLTSALLDSVR